MQKIFLAIALFSFEGLSSHQKNNLYGPGNFVLRGKDNNAFGAWNFFDGDSNSAIGNENYI